MKPASFQYHAPETVQAMLALLARHGDDGKLIAGGQSLVPTMNFRLARPAHLLDMNGIAELDEIAKINWLHEKGIGAQLIGAVDVVNAVGSGEDDDREGCKGGLAANPLENLEAIFVGHFQVEQDQAWKRVIEAD